MNSTRALRRVFASILATSVTAGTAAALLGACGSSGKDSSCRAVTPADAAIGPCGHWTVTVTGDFTGCGFEDSGRPPRRDPSNNAVCAPLCNASPESSVYCALTGDQLSCNYACGVDGRRYHGLDATRAPSIDGLGAYFTRMGFFEASSVHAFRLLERELRVHLAPPKLLRAVRTAARDEAHHATMANELAVRFGAACVPAVESPSRPDRPLEEIARENAVEGCIREAFGALVSGFQAEHALLELQPFFARIHYDETRHAALAYDIDRWLMSQLSQLARERVNVAREEALRALSDEIGTAPLPVLVAHAGHPMRAVARSLLEAFVAHTRAGLLEDAA